MKDCTGASANQNKNIDNPSGALQGCVRNESFQNYSSIHETAGTALGYVLGVLR